MEDLNDFNGWMSLSTKRRKYKGIYQYVKEQLKDELGKVTYSPHAWQLLKYKSNDGDVTLVFYPHKSSAGNRHLRVRDENSKNKNEALRIMIKSGVHFKHEDYKKRNR